MFSVNRRQRQGASGNHLSPQEDHQRQTKQQLCAVPDDRGQATLRPGMVDRIAYFKEKDKWHRETEPQGTTKNHQQDELPQFYLIWQGDITGARPGDEALDQFGNPINRKDGTQERRVSNPSRPPGSPDRFGQDWIQVSDHAKAKQGAPPAQAERTV